MWKVIWIWSELVLRISVSMYFVSALPWVILAGYAGLIFWLLPASTSPEQFYGGKDERGNQPTFWLLVSSSVISWIFAKSIANASNMASQFGILGGIGYSLYYIGFLVAGLVIYLLRTRGGYRSLSHFLTERYGPICARIFLVAISIRLYNEVWSNTKVASLYFGNEGTAS